VDPNCGLTASQAQLMYLTPYSEIPGKLQKIADSFAFGDSASIQWGPLIDTDSNGGLLNIDVALAESCDPGRMNCNVCGNDNTNATLREAVVCTVQFDPLEFPTRGNTDVSKVGFSTQGRTLYAIRMGNFAMGKRTLLMSQLHGNEPTGTEAFLQTASAIADGTHPKAESLLLNLDMLFVIRVNVDGGEPSAHNFADDNAEYYRGEKNYTANQYFDRPNVDPSAGGNRGATDGNPLSEPEFWGIVGLGYDLNRYLYANFDKAIRPVEAQSVVAALHVFQPKAVLDAHSDMQNVVCAVDPFSFRSGGFYGGTFECLGSVPTPTVTTAREMMVETRVASWLEGPPESKEVQLEHSLASSVINYIRPKMMGHVQRFALLGYNGAPGSGTSDLAANAVGAVHLAVETMAMGVAFRPTIVGYSLAADGAMLEPTLSRRNPVIEPCFLPDAICNARLATEAFLLAIVDEEQPPPSTDEYCLLPYINGGAADYRAEDGWDSGYVSDGLHVEPGPGWLLYGNSLLAGTCPSDPDNS